MVFQPSSHSNDESSNEVYQDKDIIVGKFSSVSKSNNSEHKLLWRPEWIQEVKNERQA
jgi:hypothetical protein